MVEQNEKKKLKYLGLIRAKNYANEEMSAFLYIDR